MQVWHRYLPLLRWILILTRGVICYNVDIDFHILYHENPLDNYFGFSVGLIETSNGFRALITAPRANSSSAQLHSLHQPGALYSCSISTSEDNQTCEEVEVDPEGNVNHERPENPDLSYFNKRDDMWLGVSLDTQHVSKNNSVVVCGHLWKNELSKTYYANGACYLLGSDLNTRRGTVDKIVPFVDTKMNISSRWYNYSHAQAGASAAFSEDGRSLLLGSPGFIEWKGTYVRYQMQNLTDPIIPSMEFRSTQSAYIGYSITSGKFFGDGITYSAVGAPRDSGYKGRVYVFRLPSTNYDYASGVPLLNVTGTQVGEYFGASVNGIDINGDGLTDLLVGAPFYSENSGGGDEGKIYVYIGSKQVTFSEYYNLHGENKPNARFGTCIGNTGDLNQDGFNDVAIGAPYEDEKGAVYIYHGGINGIRGRYAQRICAEEFRSPIAGFGISISRGLDIDNNSYPDLLIGSYASSSAVLLRTYPVIRLSSSLSFDITKIDMNVTACDIGGLKGHFPCVNVTYCLGYTGKYGLPSFELQTKLTIDTNRQRSAPTSRGFFLSDEQKQVKTSVSRQIQISSSGECFQETAYIYKNITDEINPIQFLLSYGLNRSATVVCQSTGFPKDCPVIDPKSPSAITKSISFITNCEGVCEADLSVEALIAGNERKRTLVVGQNSSLTLDVTVKNKGEPAYVTELFINLPPETPLVKYDQCVMGRNQWEEHVNTTLFCKFGNLEEDETAKVQIVMDAKNIPAETTSLTVYFKVTTVSNDTDMTNNQFTLPIYFETAADVNIIGNPENPRIPHTEKRGKVSVTHNYYVKYYGPSPLDNIGINIYVPSFITGENGPIAFLTVNDFQQPDGEISTKCNSTFNEMGFKSDKENEEPLGTFETPGENSSRLPSHHITKRSSEERITDSVAQRGKDYTLDCEHATCEVIHCDASPFRSGQKSIKFVLTVQIDLDVFSTVMDEWNSIEFITKGEISVGGVKMFSNLYHNETSVETVIVRLKPAGTKKVENWIIFVSVGVGLLLVLIILAVLIKIGFFKRKQRERMKSMRHQVQVKEMTEMSSADNKELCPKDKSQK